MMNLNLEICDFKFEILVWREQMYVNMTYTVEQNLLNIFDFNVHMLQYTVYKCRNTHFMLIKSSYMVMYMIIKQIKEIGITERHN